jgi:hypothetical protein
LRTTKLFDSDCARRDTAPQFNLFAPVHVANTTQLKAVLGQGFIIGVFAVFALAGIDNSSIQLIWRDVTPGVHENSSILFTLNANATNVGSFSFSTTVPFYERTFQFEFHNLGGNQDTFDVGVLVGLLLGLLLVVILTGVFLKNRCARARVCLCGL